MPEIAAGHRSLAAQGRLPLAFMVLGLAWLAVGSVMLAVNPRLLTVPHTSPPAIALTHAWVLGVFVTVACGASYQLAPVALGSTLWSSRAAWAHCGLHAIGVPGMVWAFWRWNLALLAPFAVLTALGLVLFAVNIVCTVWISRRRSVTAASLALAAGWLATTGAAGLLLAANRRWGFLAEDPVALLRAHAHLGLIGFFVTLLQGVPIQLVTMFTLAEMRDGASERTALVLTQVGLLGLVPSLALEIRGMAVVSAALIVAGFGLSGKGLARMMATRKRRPIEPALRAFFAGMIALGLALLAGMTLLRPNGTWGWEPGGMSAAVYALLFIGGGLLPCIAGMMCKIVPFLTWMRAYGPLVGHRSTPSAAMLIHPRIEALSLCLLGPAVALLVAGAWTLNESLLRLGGGTLAAAAALFIAAMAGVLRHLWRPPSEISSGREIPS